MPVDPGWIDIQAQLQDVEGQKDRMEGQGMFGCQGEFLTPQSLADS